MAEHDAYQARRRELRARYLPHGEAPAGTVPTAGVDHLALICSDLEATIEFYTRVLGMRLTRIMTNRDEPSSISSWIWGAVISWPFSTFRKRGRPGPSGGWAVCIM